MSDIYDEQAERLLPCYCYRHLQPLMGHNENCPAYYYSTVAAALREIDQRMTTANLTLVESNISLSREIADLRAERDELKARLDFMVDACAAREH